MALQSSYSSEYGASFDNAYIVISIIGYNKGLFMPAPSARTTSVTVHIYADATARENEVKPLDVKTYEFDLDTSSDADDLLAQAYAHIKTLNEFSDATDV